MLRDRLDTCERLANAGTPATASAIEAYAVAEDLIAQRLGRHQAFFEQVLSRLPGAAQ